MLKLTRKPGEKIHIGNDIVIVINAIARGQVEVGIDAPRSIPVHRGEIYEQIQTEEKSEK